MHLITKRNTFQQRTTEALRGARLTLRYLEATLPDFIRDAVIDAICAAADFKGVKVFDDEACDLDADALAVLFLAAEGLSLRRGPEALALHLSAVLNNDELPTDIYNSLADGVCDLTSSRALMDSPDVLAMALRIRANVEASKVA